mmetsp:Transcript_73015/g.171183  ORF Transcript_73015/g.171183 Transcript_73015/m.171183 type:complete len:231 (-) Transcript_73015:1738-2430(-)
MVCAFSTIQRFSSPNTYVGELTGRGNESKIRPEITSAASPDSFLQRISFCCCLALSTTMEMSIDAMAPRSVPTNKRDSSGQLKLRDVIPTVASSDPVKSRTILEKKSYGRNGGTDQKIAEPASAVTMRGASRKYSQQDTACVWFTAHLLVSAICLAKSALYQQTSPSSVEMTSISRQSCANLKMTPAALTSMRFNSSAFFSSVSSCTLMTFSGADKVRTFPVMHSICATS